jgi:hypothetical protein
MEDNIEVLEIYGYVNSKGQKVWTPNYEFARLMAIKNNCQITTESFS